MVDMREELKNIYSVIKECDAFIKFVFLTGVSQFSRVSLFSGLNNLQDISLDSRYATICGYRHEELIHTFQERLEQVNLNHIKTWYNGYNFLGKTVYNPYNILLYLDRKIFKNYWFETAIPIFIIKLIQKKRYFIPALEHLKATETVLKHFDIDRIELTTLLFQTGYLTITAKKNIGIREVY